MPLPSWYEPGDPYAARRMRQLIALGAGEQQVRDAALTAIGEFLALARAGVLGEATPDALTAAASDEEPPDLGGWPTIEQWAEILRRSLLPPISLLFGEQFYAQARAAAISVTGYVGEYMQTVFDRLVIWPVDAFNDVRAELQEGLTTGDDTRQLRERIGRVLNIDAPSRALQAQINELARTIADPDTPAQVRREARARRAALYRRQDDEDRLWQWKAARIARTEALGAMNGGTYLGALAYAEASGETRYKQWWGTSDNRIRSSHWAAHMRVAQLDELFSVGGFELTRPGDPTGPGREVINCRCTLLILNADEAARERERYARERPSRTDIEGRYLDDNGMPIGQPGDPMPEHVDQAATRTRPPGEQLAAEPDVEPEPEPEPADDEYVPGKWRQGDRAELVEERYAAHVEKHAGRTDQWVPTEEKLRGWAESEVAPAAWFLQNGPHRITLRPTPETVAAYGEEWLLNDWQGQLTALVDELLTTNPLPAGKPLRMVFKRPDDMIDADTLGATGPGTGNIWISWAAVTEQQDNGGWFMPSAGDASASWWYIVAHEWGHAIDTHPETEIKELLHDHAGHGAHLSQYGQSHEREAIAELFAHRFLAPEVDPLTQAFADRYRWRNRFDKGE